MKTRIFFYLLLVSFFVVEAQQERILSFTSIIDIHKDSTISVEETIKTHITDTGKHGIVREFPTTYTDRWGNKFTIGFKVEKILKDGQPVPFKITDAPNGKKIYIGEAHTTLSPGIYTYALLYTTDRQIGFFKEWDELYWNVTGTGWRLPIDTVFAQVSLPGTIPPTQLNAEAYTGAQGEKGKNYKVNVTSDGKVIFQTTRPLNAFEGLTIVVTWPKGYVNQPSKLWQWYQFMRDNLAVPWLLLGFIITLLLYLRVYRKARRTKTGGTVIPLFEPPQGLLPSQVKYLYTRAFDSKTFASEIVTMAVEGLLEIKYSKGKLFGGTYSLHAKSIKDAQHEDHKALGTLLFRSSPTIEITQKNQPTIQRATKFLQESLYHTIGQKYFDFNSDSFLAALLISGGFIFTSLFMQHSSLWFIGALIAFGLMHLIFYNLIQTYTPAGSKLYTAIEGFKLFLKTTEEERLKIIGTPPTKTPELFEKYLPYAIALGVEEAWSKKFAPIFALYKKEGHPYTPVWYIGPRGYFNPHALSTSFTSSLRAAAGTVSSIASSSTIPGSSTGSGGRGSSGGGGGGGGGGTW